MNLRRVALIVFVACLVGGIASAQVARPSLGQTAEIVELDLSPDLASWNVRAANDGVTLRVTGPRDFVYEAAFAAGETIYFDFVDESGATLADGLYNWEIVITPADSVRARDESVQTGRIIPAQSGQFRIESGLAVSPDLQEGGLRARDIIHADDVIINGGSLCVGFDCINGESFGADTIRLKENNLRIHFDDTSNSASFPTTNWRIVANSQSNGGGSFFQIQDADTGRGVFQVDANARSNALRIDSQGDIGIGTATPVVELHVVSGDTPTLRLEQNTSSGFAAQTWDLAGNETNFFVRDATNGSTLPFKIRPGASNNVIVIDTDDDVGIGAGTSPSAALHVRRTSGDAQIFVEEASGTAATRTTMQLTNNGRNRFEIENTNTAGGGANGGVAWRFDVPDSGDFRITKAGNANSVAIFLDVNNLLRLLDDTGTEQFRLEDDGDLVIAGNITKAGGGFRIDHPLDPANQYLNHSFVESPQRMNLYHGVAQLDENGQAWVDMPEWFTTLNSDVHYQLTSVGAAAPELHVASELAEGRFQIAGGVPGTKVSWQLTGVRQDPWAVANPLPVEEAKPLSEVGTYQFKGYLETEEAYPSVKAPRSQEPADVVARKNAEITRLGYQNAELQEQLLSMMERIAALEKTQTAAAKKAEEE